VSLDERSRVIFVSNYHDAWQRLAEMITLHQDAIYYWGKVIHTHLHQTGPTPVQNQLKPYLIDLHHIFADTVAVPARSTGLQAIANYLGYHWQGAKAPYEAHIAYLLWISEKRLDLLHEACTYMEHNAQAVEHIWRWLTFHAPGNGP
jgi:predicted RecB family nuclease